MTDAKPTRKPLRLESFNYASAGAYFVTMCTHQRRHVFANTLARSIAESHWTAVPGHHPDVMLDTFVVMPNHVHALLWLGQDGSPSTLGAVVGSYKSAVTREYRLRVRDETVWQRGYHDHVVRSDRGLDRVRRYIIDNPAKWHEDPYNAERETDAGEAMFWSELGGFERI